MTITNVKITSVNSTSLVFSLLDLEDITTNTRITTTNYSDTEYLKISRNRIM